MCVLLFFGLFFFFFLSCCHLMMTLSLLLFALFGRCSCLRCFRLMFLFHVFVAVFVVLRCVSVVLFLHDLMLCVFFGVVALLDWTGIRVDSGCRDRDWWTFCFQCNSSIICSCSKGHTGARSGDTHFPRNSRKTKILCWCCASLQCWSWRQWSIRSFIPAATTATATAATVQSSYHRGI